MMGIGVDASAEWAGRPAAPAASLRIGWPSPGHRLAPRNLPERLTWARLCPCLKTGCLPCFRNVYFFHPQKMDSLLPWLTREPRFLLLALRPCEP